MDYPYITPTPPIVMVPAVRLRVGETLSVDSSMLPNGKNFSDPTWALSGGGCVTLGTPSNGGVVVTATAPGICYLIATVGTSISRMFIEVIANYPDIIILTSS